MRVAISSLPQSPWWGEGIISYEDNPFMKNGVIPNQSLLTKERDNLINTLKKNKIEVIEFPFPEKLEKTTYGYDYVFIRDGFISDLNGKALILNFSQKHRQPETKLIADYLEKLNFDKFDNIRKTITEIFEKNDFEIQSNAGIIFSTKREKPYHLIAPLNATDEYYDVLNTTLTNLKKGVIK